MTHAAIQAPEFTEICDVCGKQLDQMRGEDLYDEPNGAVYCAEHWPYCSAKDGELDGP